MTSPTIGGNGPKGAVKADAWLPLRCTISLADALAHPELGLDDAVGAVAVHGYAGFAGLVIAGFVLWGQPSSPYEGFAIINPLGMFIGALIMFGVLGFLPGYAMAAVLNAFGLLRVSRKVELEGLDFASDEAYRVALDDVRGAEQAMLKT